MFLWKEFNKLVKCVRCRFAFFILDEFTGLELVWYADAIPKVLSVDQLVDVDAIFSEVWVHTL